LEQYLDRKEAGDVFTHDDYLFSCDEGNSTVLVESSVTDVTNTFELHYSYSFSVTDFVGKKFEGCEQNAEHLFTELPVIVAL